MIDGIQNEDCCFSKTVGPYSYTLLDNESAPPELGCMSSCVYQRDGEENSKFCFKPGQLPVECTYEVPMEISIFNNVAYVAYGTIFAYPIKKFEELQSGKGKNFNILAGSIENITAGFYPPGPGNAICLPLTDIPQDATSFSIQPYESGIYSCKVSVGP